jgi:hypothetical protein
MSDKDKILNVLEAAEGHVLSAKELLRATNLKAEEIKPIVAGLIITGAIWMEESGETYFVGLADAPKPDPNASRRAYKIYISALNAINGASNLSAVAHALSEAVTEIWTEARERERGTEYVNTHPAVKLFLYQMAHLAFGKEPFDLLSTEQFGACMEACRNGAGRFLPDYMKPRGEQGQ